MRGNILFVLIILIVLLGLDLYVFQGIRTLMQNAEISWRRFVYGLYWTISLAVIVNALWFFLLNGESWPRLLKSVSVAFQTANFFPKIFLTLFLLLDDLQRGIRWAGQKLAVLFGNHPIMEGADISRSEFLLKSGVVLATIPLVSVSYGVLAGAHDYKVRRVKLPLKNLPSGFHGLTIAQISDIHTGSFYSKTAVQGGVDMLMREHPDLVFFTGDLVNEVAQEVKDYVDIFKKVKAPLGVYSTLGNHDYGDYVQWPSAAAKHKNLQQLKDAHKYMGWDLLINENRILNQGGDKLALVGVENWGAGKRWPKYGKLDLAMQGTEECSTHLLLSHDPSHWDAQVRKLYPNIDVTFSGHTHGCQFGVEIGGFRWSPAQYFYKQWAGLYQENDQYLYVNRGYGFIGFPGRVGMPPEITIFELVKA